MAALVRMSLVGIVFATASITDLQGADAPVHFRSQGIDASWGGQTGFGGSDEGQWGWGGLLTFSPDSKLLIRQLDDSTLVLWQLDEKREQTRLHHVAWLRFARFSPDSRLLLVALDKEHSGNDESQVVVWDLQKEAIIHRLEVGRGCGDAEFSRDGRQIVTSTVARIKSDPTLNKVVVWDTAAGEELAQLKVEKRGREHREANASLHFSTDGKWLLTSTADGTTIWDTSNCQRVRLLTGSSGSFRAVFSSDSRYVFAACQGRSSNVPLGVRVWNTETGKKVAETTFEVSKEESGGCWFNLSPDGRSLVTTASISNRQRRQHLRTLVKHWDMLSGQERVLQMQTDRLHWWYNPSQFSPDGETLAFVPWQPHPEVKFISTKYWTTPETFDMSLPEDAQLGQTQWPRVLSLQFSPDGRWFAASRNLEKSREHEVFLWRLEDERKPAVRSDPDK